MSSANMATKFTSDRGVLDYAFGLVWAMAVLPPAIAVHATHRSSWLVLVPLLPALGFFFGWCIVQYRRSDWMGTQKQSWLTVRQRQSWHKRVRLIAALLFVETMGVFAVSGSVRGDAAFLGITGLLAALVPVFMICGTWFYWRQVLTTDGWRW
jgi:hypothetical protein